MARLIVRISYDHDIGGGDTGRTRKALEDAGVVKIGTGVYEGFIDLPTATDALRAVLDVIDTPNRGSLDHLWVYIDDAVPR